MLESRENIPDSAIILFHDGLPGVPGRQFVILKPEGLEPIVMLQSLDDPDVGIPAIPCASVVGDYHLEFDGNDREALELNGDSSDPELLYLAVLLVDGQEHGPCCNLAAPIVINPANNRGRQVTRLDSTYAALHPISGD